MVGVGLNQKNTFFFFPFSLFPTVEQWGSVGIDQRDFILFLLGLFSASSIWFREGGQIAA